MFAKALDNTIQHFGLSAREISTRTGITEATISQLRSGKSDAKISTFESLIKALPEEARNYLFFKSFINENVSSRDISHLLTAIASVIRDSDQVDVEVTENFINRPTKL